MTTTIILEDYDAEQFKLFQKHRDLFNKLEEHKVFDMSFGKVVLNIAFAKLQNVVKEEVIFRLPTERRVNR